MSFGTPLATRPPASSVFPSVRIPKVSSGVRTRRRMINKRSPVTRIIAIYYFVRFAAFLCTRPPFTTQTFPSAIIRFRPWPENSFAESSNRVGRTTRIVHKILRRPYNIAFNAHATDCSRKTRNASYTASNGIL